MSTRKPSVHLQNRNKKGGHMKDSTHDEVDVDGWLVLLTALADTRELPLGLLL